MLVHNCDVFCGTAVAYPRSGATEGLRVRALCGQHAWCQSAV